MLIRLEGGDGPARLDPAKIRCAHPVEGHLSTAFGEASIVFFRGRSAPIVVGHSVKEVKAKIKDALSGAESGG